MELPGPPLGLECLHPGAIVHLINKHYLQISLFQIMIYVTKPRSSYFLVIPLLVCVHVPTNLLLIFSLLYIISINLTFNRFVVVHQIPV